MMKKTGIIVGASAALLLAVTPLALAHESADSPQCEFSAVGTNDAEQVGVGGSSLLGAGGLVGNVTGAQANTQTQAPAASCNEIEDVLDLNVEDNVQDNSSTSDVDTDTITDSFNTED